MSTWNNPHQAIWLLLISVLNGSYCISFHLSTFYMVVALCIVVVANSLLSTCCYCFWLLINRYIGGLHWFQGLLSIFHHLSSKLIADFLHMKTITVKQFWNIRQIIFISWSCNYFYIWWEFLSQKFLSF